MEGREGGDGGREGGREAARKEEGAMEVRRSRKGVRGEGRQGGSKRENEKQRQGRDGE